MQNRITTLMIISSAIFIGVFTFIQVNNQLSSVNRFNIYQANLSTSIIKNNLELILNKAQDDGLRRKEYFDSELLKFREAGILSRAIVFDANGKIIASTDTKLQGENASYKDIGYFEKLNNLSEKDKWFTAEIDKARHVINIFMPLKASPEQPVSYVVKSTFPFATAQEAFAMVYYPVATAIIIVIIANIIFGYTLSKAVLGPIKVLNKVTKIIAEGDLTVRTRIQTNDELEELGNTFNYMTEQLIKMKERAENANPLTKLPGNIMIHEEIDRRIKENVKFEVIYCDLDNFKAFNDKYGIAKGDLAIKLTADIFKESVKTTGAPGDFVGHEGGDDFVLITLPEKAKSVADYITGEFDKRVRSLYDEGDLKQGYIIAHARDGAVKKFPIMAISLAGVSNARRLITSYGEITNIVAEIKKKAKAIEGSIFVEDQRTNPASKDAL